MRRNRPLALVAALSLGLAGLGQTGCTSSSEPAAVAAHTEAHAIVPAASHVDHAPPAAPEVADTAAATTAARSPQQIRAEAIEHIEHYHSIALSPEQARVKEEALSALPAPCCSDYSAATCCCPCNLAKTIWGLSHYVIAKENAGVAEVRAAVQEWLQAANPGGFKGNACFTPGGCERPFHQDGCGGMEEGQLS